MGIKKDFYKILHISRNASLQDIKKSYRKLAMEYHPDMTKNDLEKSIHFKSISEAYNTLSNPVLRREYDSNQNYGSTMSNPYYKPSGYASSQARDIPHPSASKRTGINEEVWYAHHYGSTHKPFIPQEFIYGKHILREMQEHQDKKKTTSFFGEDAGYFIRREARLRQEEDKRKQAQRKKKLEEEESCTIL